MKSILFVLLTTLCLACAPEWAKPPMGNVAVATKGHIFVCLDIPDEQMPAAKEALVMWNRALSEWKEVVEVDGHREPCSIWVHEISPAQARDAGHETALAYAPLGRNGEVSLVKGRYERGTTVILMHEIGHVLGAQHVPGTLMHEHYDRGMTPCPDKTTVAQVAAWAHIPLVLLGWCIP